MNKRLKKGSKYSNKKGYTMVKLVFDISGNEMLVIVDDVDHKLWSITEKQAKKDGFKLHNTIHVITDEMDELGIL